MFHIYVTTTLKSHEWKRGSEEGRFSGCPRGRGGFARRPAPHSSRRQLTGVRPLTGRSDSLKSTWGSATSGARAGVRPCAAPAALGEDHLQHKPAAHVRRDAGRSARSGQDPAGTPNPDREFGAAHVSPRATRVSRAETARAPEEPPRWEDAERAPPARPREELRARALPARSRDGTQPGQGRTRRQRPRALPSRIKHAATTPTCSPRPLRSDPRRPRARTYVRGPVLASVDAAGLEPLRTRVGGADRLSLRTAAPGPTSLVPPRTSGPRPPGHGPASSPKAGPVRPGAPDGSRSTAGTAGRGPFRPAGVSAHPRTPSPRVGPTGVKPDGPERVKAHSLLRA